ncbi:MAG: hypothetical protein H6Q37_2464 [Chloroflexi bacterium]|jgi:hypothetical protein|nr:hypothetical protein [Chloroflexota bacterium]
MIGLALAIVTLVALIAWFLLGRIALYQSSTSAELQLDGQIVASFPVETFNKLKYGQNALLRLGQSGDQRPVSLPAVVFDTQGGNEQVILVLADVSTLPDGVAEGTKGRVDVETEKISPAELLLRASGKFLAGGRSATPAPATPASLP